MKCSNNGLNNRLIIVEKSFNKHKRRSIDIFQSVEHWIKKIIKEKEQSISEGQSWTERQGGWKQLCRNNHLNY